MENNYSYKKPKLQQMQAESNMEEDIDNIMVTVENDATINDNINQSNALTVDIPDSGERKTCKSTKLTSHADHYRFFK